MMNMLAIVISLLCAGFVLFQRHFFGLPGQSREKQSKPGTSRSEPPHAKSLVPSSEILVSKSYRSGLERTGADIGTAPAGMISGLCSRHWSQKNMLKMKKAE